MPSSERMLIAGLLAGMFWVFALVGSAGAVAQPAVSLEKAIQIVRQNFEIPVEFSDFSSGLNEYGSGQVWYLSWNRPDKTGGNFSAQVDSSTGEIISMNCWQPQVGGASRIPIISWQEARQTATELLQRLIPNRMSSLVMIDEPEPSPISSGGTVTYTINWRRVENQVPFEGVAAWVSINANNGKVQAYNLSWVNLPLPDPHGSITPTAAQQRLIDNKMIRLQYQLPDQVFPMTAQNKTEPILVYILDHPSNGTIDALTGQPLLPPPAGPITGGKGMGGMAEDSASPVPVPLTPEEQQEIQDLAGLISQDQAAAIIMKWAETGPNMVLRSASLEKDWQNPDIRIWSLNWSSGQDKTYQSLYGRVNARTGELLSFNVGLPMVDREGIGISQSEARSKAESFLSRIQGPRVTQFKFDPDSSAGLGDIKIPPIEWPVWNFKYIRVANGIEFPANGADISVDRIHDRVTSYVLNWNYAQLPKPEGIIRLEEANRIYLQNAPLTLTYAGYYSGQKNDTEMRLVYQPKVPDGQPSFRMIDAYRGQLLDYRGRPVVPIPSTQVFSDISTSFAAPEITLLGKAGLMKEYGQEFRPGEAIAAADLLRAMLGIYQGPESIRGVSDNDIVKRAIDQGWVEAALPPDSNVERGLMAKIIVCSLDLKYLAEIEEIYQLPYRDAALIDKDLKGYAALCWGLGIIRGDGVRFAPQHIVTREEAAMALVRSLGVKR